MENKTGILIIRIDQDKKNSWKKICSEREISLTRLVIDSVEGRTMEDQRRNISMFIKKQDNIFVKIETNINQVAKVANAQRSISEQVLKKISDQVAEIIKLKQEQNEIFRNIYAMLAK